MHYFDVELLQFYQHVLQTRWGFFKLFFEDRFKRFVVRLNNDFFSVDVIIELLAGEHDS